MAYAEVAGVSPVNGLYALLLPTLAYALLGTLALRVADVADEHGTRHRAALG